MDTAGIGSLDDNADVEDGRPSCSDGGYIVDIGVRKTKPSGVIVTAGEMSQMKKGFGGKDHGQRMTRI